MRMRWFWRLSALVACISASAVALGVPAEANQQPAAASTQARQPQSTQTPGGKLLQAGPASYRGVLGSDEVKANLREKADAEEGFEGDYFLFGHPQQVLLAGEVDGNDVFMEESVNGTDVSGSWNGKLEGDTISGTWQSADGLVIKPFSMKIVRIGGQAQQSVGNPAGQARQ